MAKRSKKLNSTSIKRRASRNQEALPNAVTTLWAHDKSGTRVTRRYSYFRVTQRVVVEDFDERGGIVSTREFVEFFDASGKGLGLREMSGIVPLPV